MSKNTKQCVVPQNDLLYLIQQLVRYEQGLADGTVCPIEGRKFCNSLVRHFKRFL